MRGGSDTPSAPGSADTPPKRTVRLSVEFRDRRGTPVALTVLGPVTAGERGGRTGLVERDGEAAVPPGARSARLLLVFTRTGSGTSNDGYADAIFLTLSTDGDRS